MKPTEFPLIISPNLGCPEIVSVEELKEGKRIPLIVAGQYGEFICPLREIFAGAFYLRPSDGGAAEIPLHIKDDPGIVSNLFVLEGEQETVSPWLVPFRAVYFSIVTMTTLGFGDMYANAHSFLRGLFGHALLALQVILGYVLLAALVTRFAVLFTAGGPAGEFSKESKKKG